LTGGILGRGKEQVMTPTELEQLVATLTDRVRRLEDAEAIVSLHSQFTRAVADRHFVELARYFCDDATIDMRRHGPMSGRSAIAEHFAGMAAVPLGGAGYVLSSPVIEIDGDTATGTWTWHRFYADSDTNASGRTWEEGRYRCAYRRTADGWRFARMHFRVVSPEPDDAPQPTGENSC
jgi:uncharacterized protein (TIGR02246 family)